MPLFDEWNNPIVLIPKNQEEMLKLWSLSSPLFPELLPKRDELEAWCSSLWDECKNLSITNIVNAIETSGNLKSLENKLKGQNLFAWLNEFYKLLLTSEDNDCKNAKDQATVF